MYTTHKWKSSTTELQPMLLGDLVVASDLDNGHIRFIAVKLEESMLKSSNYVYAVGLISTNTPHVLNCDLDLSIYNRASYTIYHSVYELMFDITLLDELVKFGIERINCLIEFLKEQP